jgi:hypothetical protein
VKSALPAVWLKVESATADEPLQEVEDSRFQSGRPDRLFPDSANIQPG